MRPVVDDTEVFDAIGVDLDNCTTDAAVPDGCIKRFELMLCEVSSAPGRWCMVELGDAVKS